MAISGKKKASFHALNFINYTSIAFFLLKVWRMESVFLLRKEHMWKWLNGDLKLNWRNNIEARVTLAFKSGGGKGENYTKGTTGTSILKLYAC